MPADSIHVWSLALDTITEPQWSAFAAILDEGERHRAGQFHFDNGRQAFIAAHALVRCLLSHMDGRAPGLWRFAAEQGGKPYAIDSALAFSLSHSRGMVAVAATAAGRIGVDLEPLARRFDIRIANRYFAPEETAALQAIPDDLERAEYFIRLWTLKESFVKATGKGLSQPLDAFAFVSLDPVRLAIHDHDIGDPASWMFWQHSEDGYVLAVSAELPFGARPPSIVHRSASQLSGLLPS